MRYREHAPPAHLARHVECFWTYEADLSHPDHLVLPDGCEDIFFAPGKSSLAAVGTMTRAQVYAHGTRETLVGVRFHPAMARPFLGIAANALTDSIVDLGSLWGARGEQLRRRLSEVSNAQQAIDLLARELEPVSETPVQRMVLWVVEQGGRIRLDDLARFAGLSQRQIRRVFLEQTGLSPKLFCRVVRFHGLVNRLSAHEDAHWADLALDHGYYDQSHMVNEFHELSGLTPTSYVARP